MNVYKVDLDYESFLFDPNYCEDSPQSQKIINEFEYVFFLINKDPNCSLKNYKKYEKNYLEKLKKLGFEIPHLIPDANEFEYWWGNRHDYALEQNLNSKITSAILGKSQGWGFFNGAIVENASQLKEHLLTCPTNKKWIIKKPFSFSGIGHYQFDSENLNEFILSKIIQGPVLLEPLYKRVFDIGTTFVLDKGKIIRKFMVENFNGDQGGFRGGVGASNDEKFKKYIYDKYNFDLAELEKTTSLIAQEYIKRGAIKNIQIDSFVYLDGDQYKIYPLVEVNYRKTMGLVIQSLADKNPQCSHIEWRVNTKKEIEQNLNFYQDSSMVRLSPDGTHFQTYLKLF